MNRVYSVLLVVITITTATVLSCNKEDSCEGCSTANKPPIVVTGPGQGGNEPPVAVAGPDQRITFPADSVLLNGTASSDADGNIMEWQWTKIAGPASFNFRNSNLAETIVRTLEQGVYQFELKVTDDKGASARDTIALTVEDKFANSLRFDSLNTISPCIMNIPNLDTQIPAGVKFEVYIRHYWGIEPYGYSGSFYKIDTIPDAQTLGQPLSSYWYWYQYRSGVLSVYYPNGFDCNFDVTYHDVIIKW